MPNGESSESGAIKWRAGQANLYGFGGSRRKTRPANARFRSSFYPCWLERPLSERSVVRTLVTLGCREDRLASARRQWWDASVGKASRLPTHAGNARGVESSRPLWNGAQEATPAGSNGLAGERIH